MNDALPAALSAPVTPPPAQSANALRVSGLDADHRPQETTAFFDDLKAGNVEVSVSPPVEISRQQRMLDPVERKKLVFEVEEIMLESAYLAPGLSED